jgi:RHS repeat-associated protein
MRPSNVSSGSHFLVFVRNLAHQFFRRAVQRRVVCCAVALNLLLLPGPGLITQDLLALGEQVLHTQIGSHSYEAFFLGRLFSRTTARPRHDTMADRAAAVRTIRLNPTKYVGYVDETISLTALPTDHLDRTVQGVKFSWESSNPDKVLIDDTGRATFLQPGLARITCRAGSVSRTAPMLVRPNQRPRQTDAEWRADQARLHTDGTEASNGSESTNPIASLIDKLVPTASAQIGGGGVPNTDFAYDELWSDPANLVGSPRNRAVESTRLGTVLPEGSNFNFMVPLVNASGRGIDTSVALHYNSRVWSQHGNAVTFDPVTSWPSPGFSLGFGRIVTYNVQSTTCRYMLVDADGTRRYLGQGNISGSNTLQTSDGSHITYAGDSNGGSLYYNNGLTVTYSILNNRLLPTRIVEKNSNFIQIAYKSAVDEYGSPTVYPPAALDYVTDTLGRVIYFGYNETNGALTSVSAFGFTVNFEYESRTISGNFSGLTVENRPAVAINCLRRIYFPATGTGWRFSYSDFGMILGYSLRRQMPYSGGDGIESANVSFNYPTSGTLSAPPAFTQRTETATNSPTSVYTYSTTIDTVAQTKTFTISRPDSSTVSLARSTNNASPSNGLLVQSEIKNSGGTSFGKSTLTYVNDGGGSPQAASLTVYDDASPANQAKVDFNYDQYGNITNKREYGFQSGGAWQVRRRTHLTYKTDAAYINAYRRGLVTLTEVFDALGNTNDADDVLIAKTVDTHDDYQSMGGLEDYGGTALPPGYLGNYGVRGNVTGTTQWIDVVAGTTIERRLKYDIFGNVVKAQVACCQEEVLTTTQDTYWSEIEIETRGAAGGAQQTRWIDYDFNNSLPASVTDAGGLTTNFGYDAAMNPSNVTLPTGAMAVAGYDYANLSSTKTVTYSDGPDPLVIGGTITRTLTTTTHYDGWGRVMNTVDPTNAQVNTSYDAMGRVASRTNPFATGGTPGPATTFQYDVLGRVTITTLPDGNTVQNSYIGPTVTGTDPVNRKIKRETDGLGRLIKVTEQDVSTAALTQETSYSYNLLDKLTGVNQGGQYRSYKYDSMGRLLFEKIPEQTATINDGTGTMWSSKYTYNAFSKITTKQDARGVVTTFSYDGMNRVTGISYNTSGAPGVQATPSVSFTYWVSGAIASVTIGNEYTENYTFDDYNRPVSVTRWILGQSSDTRKTYTTSYEYNGGSQLTKIIYPSAQQVSVNHDDKGRMQSLTNDTSGYLTGVSYNIGAQVTGLTLGNGVAETFGYDANRLQLTSQVATKSGGPTGGLMNVTYGYQASAGQMGAGSTAGNAGQLMTINNSTINGTTESAAYTYDLLGRLVTSDQTTNASSAQRKFAYDRWGNRTTVWPSVFGGSPIQTVTLEQSGGAPTNRITSVTNNGTPSNYLYDAAGNVTNDGVHTYQYDAENRVVSMDNGATAQYKYDYKNRRVSKIIGSSWTHYIWQGSQVIGEHDATTAYTTNPTYQVNSARLDYIYSGNQRIYSRERATSGGSWTTKYYLNDRLSERLVLDTSGNVLGRMAHLPFGEDLGMSGTQENHHFTSYESDGESGTDYAVNRQYAQGVGRFMRVDSYNPSGDLSDPQSLNRYAYVLDDPTNRLDPTGLIPFPGLNLLPGGGIAVWICWGEGNCEWDFRLMPINDQQKEKIGLPIVVPKKCAVDLPTDPDKLDMIKVIMHEATSPENLGSHEYQNGDRRGQPSGEEITDQILQKEAANFVGAIRNFASNHNMSIHDSMAAIAHDPDHPFDQVLSEGQGFIDEAMEDFDRNPKGRCAQLKRAINAVNGIVAPDPGNYEHWRGQLQTLNGRRIVRDLRPGEIRRARTDFIP